MLPKKEVVRRDNEQAADLYQDVLKSLKNANVKSKASQFIVKATYPRNGLPERAVAHFLRIENNPVTRFIESLGYNISSLYVTHDELGSCVTFILS